MKKSEKVIWKKCIVVRDSLTDEPVKFLEHMPEEKDMKEGFSYEKLSPDEARKEFLAHESEKVTARIRAERGGRKFSE